MSSEQLYDNEKELLSSLSMGSEEALKFIYQKYWERLFLSAYNILKDKEACEDIIQEIFIQLWQRRTRLTIRTSLQIYLFTAVRYQVFHSIKKSSKRQGIVEYYELHFSPDRPDSSLYVKDIQNRISAAVENLPGKCKDIYILSREHHLSYKEIANQLHITPKTVENQLSIASKKIRSALGDLAVFFLLLFTLR